MAGKRSLSEKQRSAYSAGGCFSLPGKFILPLAKYPHRVYNEVKQNTPIGYFKGIEGNGKKEKPYIG